MKAVGSLAQWEELFVNLTTNKYRIWQTQYDTKSPEGFHTWFYSTGKPELEVVTHNEAVHDAIVNYK